MKLLSDIARLARLKLAEALLAVSPVAALSVLPKEDIDWLRACTP